MPRKLCIDAAGALHHIIARGIDRGHWKEGDDHENMRFVSCPDYSMAGCLCRRRLNQVVPLGSEKRGAGEFFVRRRCPL